MQDLVAHTRTVRIYLFGDGSLRFINENIDYTDVGMNPTSKAVYDRKQLGLYQKLEIRNDGEPIIGSPF